MNLWYTRKSIALYEFFAFKSNHLWLNNMTSFFTVFFCGGMICWAPQISLLFFFFLRCSLLWSIIPITANFISLWFLTFTKFSEPPSQFNDYFKVSFVEPPYFSHLFSKFSPRSWVISIYNLFLFLTLLFFTLLFLTVFSYFCIYLFNTFNIHFLNYVPKSFASTMRKRRE